MAEIPTFVYNLCLKILDLKADLFSYNKETFKNAPFVILIFKPAKPSEQRYKVLDLICVFIDSVKPITGQTTDFVLNTLPKFNPNPTMSKSHEAFGPR